MVIRCAVGWIIKIYSKYLFRGELLDLRQKNVSLEISISIMEK